MAVSGAEMLEAASFNRRAGIPSSPILFDVLTNLSWQFTRGEQGLTWIIQTYFCLLRVGMLVSNFSTTDAKYVQHMCKNQLQQ